MEEHKLQELIDQYPMGTLSAEDKAYLEQLIQSDPEVASRVRESQYAHKILLAAKHRQLREKLREIDRHDRRRSGFLPRWIVLLLFFVMALICFWYWATLFYGHACLARRYFEKTATSMAWPVESQQPVQIWMVANNAFRKKEYENAIQLYTSWLSEPENQGAYMARWNILLAQLAQEGPTATWKESMESFIQEAPESLNSRAQKLLTLLDSSLYGFFFYRLQANLSPLKPPLI